MSALRLTLVLAVAAMVVPTFASEPAHDDHAKGDAHGHAHPAQTFDVIGDDAHGHHFVKTIDMSKPGAAEELKQLFATAHIHEIVDASAPPISKLASLSTELGVWTLIIFVALLFVLSKMAWPKMLAGLQKREHNILSAREEAEKARTEAAAMRADLQKQLANAHMEVKGIIDEAKRDAEAAAKSIREQATADASAERDKLKREIQVASDQALQGLWTKAAELATQISSKAIRGQLDGDGHRKLIDQALKELQAAGANGHA